MNPCRRPTRARTMGIWTWSPGRGCSPPEQPPQHNPSQSIGNATPRAALAAQANTGYISIYPDMLVRSCQGSRRSGPGAVGRLVLLLAVASCTAPPAPLTSENKSNKKSVLAPWPATSCDILRPAHDRPRPAPRPASESRCPSSPACEP